MELADIFKTAQLETPATEQSISDLETKLGKKLPISYRNLLLFSNGITGDAKVQNNNVSAILWKVEEIEKFNQTLKVAERMPGLLLIGFINANVAIGIDLRENSKSHGYYYKVPLDSFTAKDAVCVGNTIEEMIAGFHVQPKDNTPSEIAQKPDTAHTGKTLVKTKYPPIHFTKTQEKIKALEEKLNTKIIVYYVPQTDMIVYDHPEYFLEHLRKIGHQEKITLVLCSFGGDPMASMRIACLLRKYCNTLEIVIPAESTSAATQLALSADKIWFSSIGYLGPIDAQITGIRDQKMVDFNHSRVSFDSFRRAYELLRSENPTNAYEKLFNFIPPLVIAEIDKLSSRSKKTAIRMMQLHPQSFNNDQSKIDDIAQRLVYGYPVHNYPILLDEAKEIGLPADELDEKSSLLLWDLVKLLRSDTKDAITYIAVDYFHVEGITAIIESDNRRIAKRGSWDYRVVEGGKRVNDKSFSEWVKLVKEDGRETRFVPIEGTEIEIKPVTTNGTNPQNSQGVSADDEKDVQGN